MRKLLVSFLLIGWGKYALSAGEPKVLFEQDSTLLTTAVSVVITSGAIDDPVNKAGLSNLLGQMLLRGTKHKNRSRFQSELERLGAVLFVFATQDAIIVQGRVIKEKTTEFLKLMEDCLLHPAFLPSELASLKTEVLAAISQRKSQNNRLSGLAIRKLTFSNTPLASPMDGMRSTVNKITLEDIKTSYNDRLHQGNLVFAAVSALQEPELKASFTRIWKAVPDGLKRAVRSITPQIPKAPTLVVVQKSATSTGAVMMGQAGITAEDPLRYTLSVSNFSFGGEALVSRLFKVIRGELGWTYSIGSSYGAMGELTSQKGIYVISSTPSIEFTGKTILKTMAMWREFYKNGLRPDELTMAKEGLINSYPFEFESAEKRLSRALHSHLYHVPILSPEEYDKKISKITNEDIKQALKVKQTEDGWIIAVVADPKVITAQLDAEQKDLPDAQKIKISKVITPDELVD